MHSKETTPPIQLTMLYNTYTPSQKWDLMKILNSPEAIRIW